MHTSSALFRSFSISMEHIQAAGGCNKSLAVAVSGGSDSMALTLLAQEWTNAHSISLTALTVDHGIRPEAKKEAQHVHTWLSARGVTHFILHNAGNPPARNIQEEARILRYTLMNDWCRKNGITHLLLAHTLNDQAETFLIRLDRGSGVDGLSAMPLIQRYNSLILCRPLLGHTRETLQFYLKEKGQEWITDPSNKDTKYTRSRIRTMLESAGMAGNVLTERLAHTAHTMGRVRQALHCYTAEWIDRTVTIHPEGFYSLDMNTLRHAPEEIGLRVLSQCLCSLNNEYKKPRFEKLSGAYRQLLSVNTRNCTLYGCHIIVSKKKNERGVVHICKEIKGTDSGTLPLTQHKQHWDGRFLVACKKKHLYAGMLGKSNWQALVRDTRSATLPKKALYSVPAFYQKNTTSLENIVAVPHIGYYTPRLTEKEVTCVFSPSVPLKGDGFYCAAPFLSL